MITANTKKMDIANYSDAKYLHARWIVATNYNNSLKSVLYSC